MFNFVFHNIFIDTLRLFLLLQVSAKYRIPFCTKSTNSFINIPPISSFIFPIQGRRHAFEKGGGGGDVGTESLKNVPHHG